MAQAAMPASPFISTALYIRLSVEDNNKRGNSIETQKLVLEKFLLGKPELRLYDIYIDNGATGTNFNRDGFQRMLSDIESGKVGCVIVKDLSRLGRNAIDTGYYIERYFPSHNVRFISVTDQFDSENPDNLHHIPLVNEEIFSKANASIQRFKIPNRKKHNYLLRGKVICGCCKHALHLANGTSYRCRFSSTIPSLDCYNIHIREKELNQLVYELLCKQFQVAFGVDSLADLRKVDTVALRQADFDRQIFELQEEKRKLYESLVSGGIPLPKYKEQKEQISERLLEVQNTKAVVMARLEAEQEERQHQRQQMDISRMLTESDGLTSELVDLLIDKIYVYPDKRVDVEFKIRDSLAAHK